MECHAYKNRRFSCQRTLGRFQENLSVTTVRTCQLWRSIRHNRMVPKPFLSCLMPLFFFCFFLLSCKYNSFFIMIKKLAKTMDKDPACCQRWTIEKRSNQAKILRTKNEKSKDYCKADHNNVYCFLRTIFRLGMPTEPSSGLQKLLKISYRWISH